MAMATKCQTPDVVFVTRIQNNQIDVSLKLPNPINLTEEEAELLEANIHNAMELVLAPFFRED